MTDSCFWVSDGVMITADGGIAVRMINDTGAAAVKGTALNPSDTVDRGVKIAAAGAYDCIGIMYSEGVPNGSECWVVIAGMARVLLKDSTASTRGNWLQVSDVPGRVDATGAIPDPPTAAEHFQEIGHCVESKTAGTDVLALAVIHFN